MKTFLASAATAVILPMISTGQPARPTMKAIVVHEYGGPEVLKYEDVPRPEPKDDQILVRVIAAGVNPVDGLIRSGMFAKYEKAAFPMIPGADIAGVVEKAGSKITKFRMGDSVHAYISLKNSGGYAEYAVATGHRPVRPATAGAQAAGLVRRPADRGRAGRRPKRAAGPPPRS